MADPDDLVGAMTQIGVFVVLAVLVVSHLGAYLVGKRGNDAALLDQAIAYAGEIVERQGRVDSLAEELAAEQAKKAPKARLITKEVVRYESLPADRRCDLDSAWRVLHDAAATGEPPEPARLAAGAAPPVGDAAALATVAGNYESCRTYIDQLEGWQRWWESVSK